MRSKRRAAAATSSMASHTSSMSPTDVLIAAAAAAAAAAVAAAVTPVTAIPTPAVPAASAAPTTTAMTIQSSPPATHLSYDAASDLWTTAAAIRAEESIERLVAFANECRQQEGTVRTPFVLLQILALVRQYECSFAVTNPAPTDATLVEFSRGMREHICLFYDNQPKYEWRAQLAWRLYATQQQASPDAMQQLLVAMAAVHLSNLYELSTLLIADNPLLLTLVLRRIAANGITYHQVRTLVKRIDLSRIEREPPTTPAETESLANALVDANFLNGATKADTGSSSLSPPPPLAPPSSSSSTVPTTSAESAAAATQDDASQKRKRRSSLLAEAAVTAPKSPTSRKKKNKKWQKQQEQQPPTSMSTNGDARVTTDAVDAATDGDEQHEAEAAIAIVPAAGQGVDQQGGSPSAAAPMEIDLEPSPSPPQGEAAAAAAQGTTSEQQQQHMPVEERRQLKAALEQSRKEAARTPAVTSEARKAYEAHIEQQLEAADRVLRVVPGNGDCLFTSVALACREQGISLAARLGDGDDDGDDVCSSDLRTFLAAWIRTHKERLYDLSGGDETWSGERLKKGAERMTLDDCLDALADTDERRYDIAWSSTDLEARGAPTNLGDYLPQLLAESLNLCIVLIQPNAPTATIGARDSLGRLVAGADRQVVLVQSIRKNHWDVALPRVRSISRPVVSIVATPAGSAADDDDGGGGDETGDVLNIRARHRVSPDVPVDASSMRSLRAQLAEAQAALERARSEAKQRQEEHERASEAAVDAALRATNHIAMLVHALHRTHPDHVYRVRSGDAEVQPDDVAQLLQQILTAQESVPPMRGGDGALPFFHLTSSVRDSWVHDVEAIEAALGGPLQEEEAERLNDVDAQEVLALIADWKHQLDQWQATSAVELSFMEMLLLVKKLRCVDQLLTAADEDDASASYRVLELEAVVPRIILHERVWSFALRLPCSYFNATHHKLVRRSAYYFKAAAKAAVPNAMEQARLLVEQCKILEQHHLLHKATGLKSVAIKYPEEPFAVLQELHARYPAAGPALKRDDLVTFDEEVDWWHEEIAKFEQRAAELDGTNGDDDEVNRQEAAAARQEAAEMRADPPRIFEQCMNKSQTFFHPDKRAKDQTTSAEDKSAQFARLKQAWADLGSYRANFQELRLYRVRVAAATATATAAAAAATSRASAETGKHVSSRRRA